MFGGRYFAGRYFADRYFGPADLAAETASSGGGSDCGWFVEGSRRPAYRFSHEHVASGGISLAGAAIVEIASVFRHVALSSVSVSGVSRSRFEPSRFAAALAEDDLLLMVI